LGSAATGRLGTLGADGWPRIKPLNFAWHGGRIYFHSAREGEKIRDIAREPRVCFEVDQPLAYVRARSQPCQATYLFRSVLLRGRAALVENAWERQEALAALMTKYQPGTQWPEFPVDKLALTAVVRIDPEEVVGKENLGTAAQRQAILGALAAGTPLPLHLD
jgi:nitroimidazol reductase NimA-like FMN-containing flavoprotein (pyridoxamine 5'-phosphate oxidase superfamily)